MAAQTSKNDFVQECINKIYLRLVETLTQLDASNKEKEFND